MFVVVLPLTEELEAIACCTQSDQQRLAVAVVWCGVGQPADNAFATPSLQVLRYQNGQKYDAHWDWFDDPTHPANSGENRCGCAAH
jgi:hypothetical protein